MSLSFIVNKSAICLVQSFDNSHQSKLINYNNHPIDKWCLSNTNIDTDRNGNIQPDKSKKRLRIDGTAALLDAYVVLEQKKNDYLNMI